MPTKTDKTRHQQLTERQRLVVEALVNGKSLTEVAKELSINRGTLWEWKKRPNFVKAIRDRQAELFSEMRGRLLALVEDAIAALSRDLKQGKNGGELALRLLELLGLPEIAKAEIAKSIQGEATESNASRDNGSICGLTRAEVLDREIERLQREKERVAQCL